jgi:hypothetical protein
MRARGSAILFRTNDSSSLCRYWLIVFAGSAAGLERDAEK